MKGSGISHVLLLDLAPCGGYSKHRCVPTLDLFLYLAHIFGWPRLQAVKHDSYGHSAGVAQRRVQIPGLSRTGYEVLNNYFCFLNQIIKQGEKCILPRFAVELKEINWLSSITATQKHSMSVLFFYGK